MPWQAISVAGQTNVLSRVTELFQVTPPFLLMIVIVALEAPRLSSFRSLLV